MTSSKGPLWEQDEFFCQKVIRQALLLGFSAREADGASYSKGERVNKKFWVFEFDGVTRGYYATIYSAALEYLRLMKVPQSIIGVDIGQI